MRHSKLSGLHSFDNMTIIYWVKNRSKTEGWAWNTNIWSNFCDLQWELAETSEISTLRERAVGMHFHVWHGSVKLMPRHTISINSASIFLISKSQHHFEFLCANKKTFNEYILQEERGLKNYNHMKNWLFLLNVLNCRLTS